jgi:hypothetical protein
MDKRKGEDEQRRGEEEQGTEARHKKLYHRNA